MPTDLDQSGRIPQITRTNLGPTVGWIMTDTPVDIEYVIDGGTQAPSTGFKGQLIIPNWLTISNWVIFSKQQGSCVVDIWKTTRTAWVAGTPPTAANSICGSSKPTLTNQYASMSSTLTGWTTTIDQNDVLAFNLDSVSSNILLVTVILQCVRNIGQT